MPVIVLDSVITHTSTWFLDREIHQLKLLLTSLTWMTLYQKKFIIFVHKAEVNIGSDGTLKQLTANAKIFGSAVW